jgi:hypothetical protein
VTALSETSPFAVWRGGSPAVCPQAPVRPIRDVDLVVNERHHSPSSSSPDRPVILIEESAGALDTEAIRTFIHAGRTSDVLPAPAAARYRLQHATPEALAADVAWTQPLG